MHGKSYNVISQYDSIQMRLESPQHIGLGSSSNTPSVGPQPKRCPDKLVKTTSWVTYALIGWFF